MRKRYRKNPALPAVLFLSFVFFAIGCQTGGPDQRTNLRFTVTFSEELSKEPLDGRLLLMISSNDKAEPRYQISDGPDTQLVFGINVEGMSPGDEAVIDSQVFGYPLKSISEIPNGTYFVQALLHKYETFDRADGHTVKLPMDRGEGQRWNQAPGNLYSTPVKTSIDPEKGQKIEIKMDKEIPPIPDPPETKYIKHIKIQSKLLTEFWGRPMHLGAHILLPEGFEEHPNTKYPLIIFHGHFPILSADSGRSHRIKAQSLNTVKDLMWKGTTSSSSSMLINFTRTGQEPISRGCLSLKSSMPIPTMTTPML